ncbi:MAG: hypothetical protein ACWA5U_01775 [bacterium]
MKHYFASSLFFLSLISLAACVQTPANDPAVPNKIKAETIEQQGKYGSIKEERIKAVNSDVRFVPHGQQGYRLVDPSLADAKESAYRDPAKPVIPSWTVGSW